NRSRGPSAALGAALPLSRVPTAKHLNDGVTSRTALAGEPQAHFLALRTEGAHEPEELGKARLIGIHLRHPQKEDGHRFFHLAPSQRSRTLTLPRLPVAAVMTFPLTVV